MTTPYFCNNEPRPFPGDPMLVQLGWTVSPTTFDENGDVIITRTPKMGFVPYRNSVECQYDKAVTDKKCEGCVHINYSLGVV